MREWYKDGSYWRHNESTGMGDLIFNTCFKIIQDVDVSPWALTALSSCCHLLKAHKRWPDRLNQENTAKNWIQWKWSKLLKNGKYSRPQGDMTRDPYIAWITACILTRNEYLIQSVTIPWYLSNPFYAPTTRRWRRRLLKDKREVYVQRLGYLRSLAVTAKFETP